MYLVTDPAYRSAPPRSIGGIAVPDDDVSRATWAWAVRRLLVGEGMAEGDADRAARAIELHMAPGVTLDDGVESVLLDRATGVDVRGTEFTAIDAVRDAVMAELPRGDFDRRFLAAIRREVAVRPGCQSERLLPRLEIDGRIADNPWQG